MNVDRPDLLDQAIDEVARTLVSAPQDREMAARLVAALPPRRSPWLQLSPRWAVHAIGAASLAAIVAAVWFGREPVPTPSFAATRPIPAVPLTSLARLAPAVTSDRTAPSALRVAMAPPAVPTDHERALAPVPDPVRMAVAALEAGALEIAPTSLEPLTIDALVDGGAPPDSKEQ